MDDATIGTAEEMDGPPAIDAIRIGMHETWITPGSVTAARAAFARAPAILLRRVVDADLRAFMIDRCATRPFAGQTRPALDGHRWVEKQPRLLSKAMMAAVGRPAMLRWIEQVTGCGPLQSVTGQLAETRPGAGDFLPWHQDVFDDFRRVAITIDLSDQPFEGGAFEMRDKASGALLLRHFYEGDGSALIYAMTDDTEHRVLPITAGGPRRVFSAWFRGVE
uniref:2OG-Fe(II) oxygenase n=1 Tax=Sphingomonas bacterium TaxID=1895847 RepID=UPI00263941A1|nr:2OG-Fe(II) oxygenase [Sphingomonas bacterium]